MVNYAEEKTKAPVKSTVNSNANVVVSPPSFLPTLYGCARVNRLI